MNQTELLAPAGNYEALIGALSAGADAIYLGGSTFGARAYADNFSQEEICEGIRYAHTLQKKIYLTVNTLVKEWEFPALYQFLIPFYEAGLDAVIVQDLGAFLFIRDHFPGLSLHVSTQMTITGPFGAKLLKSLGASRIVPARELSLREIITMKRTADIEVETFIHGAMCYCYSGQCLFSSILGGRSGNRGRCAQPCRLPYHVEDGREEYPLSMKDMCTIHLIPKLMDAGIDSFKIEGRMKKPEYAAGVTAIYRKYMNLYTALKQEGKEALYAVSTEDIQKLKSLYLRSSLSEGYYEKHNGRDMITISSPSYNGADESLLQAVRKQYIEKPVRKEVSLSAVFHAGEQAILTVTDGIMTTAAEGDIVDKAKNRPLSEEQVVEQLRKCGGTFFTVADVQTTMDPDIFMPVSRLNQLRRDALKAFESLFLRDDAVKDRHPLPFEEDSLSDRAATQKVQSVRKEQEGLPSSKGTQLHVLVTQKEQLQAVCRTCLEKRGEAARLYVELALTKDPSVTELFSVYRQAGGGEVYLALPYVSRQTCDSECRQLIELTTQGLIDGCLVRNMEMLSCLLEMNYTGHIVTDSGLYVWNSRSFVVFQKYAEESYLPIELNGKELHTLIQNADIRRPSLQIYGRFPMMVSAGCLQKTSGKCTHVPGYLTLTDRYRKTFPVYHECSSCYNILYNSVPLSLHTLLMNRTFPVSVGRLDFTTETAGETEKVLSYFTALVRGEKRQPFYQDFTTGHYKRGVE